MKTNYPLKSFHELSLWMKASKFILNSFVINKSNYIFSEKVITLKSGEEIKCDLYDPPFKAKGVIIFFHGMTMKGRRDERQVETCESLLACGYRIVSPEFPEVSQTQIQYETVLKLRETIELIYLNEDISLGRKLGIFSVSFSASIAMLAAASERMKNFISAIFSLGGFSDVETVLKFIIESEKADEYSLMIVFHNFLHLTEYGDNENLKNAMIALIRDESLDLKHASFPSFLSKLSLDEKEILEKIRTDIDFRKKLSETMFRKDISWTEKWSVRKNLSKIEIPLVLLHGKYDDVIPSSESKLLFEELGKLKKEGSLLITSLISHGDKKLDINSAKEFPNLLGSFKSFFSYIEKA